MDACRRDQRSPGHRGADDAGAGSEVGRAAGDQRSDAHGEVIFHPAVADDALRSELTVGMPPIITAGTGMDACWLALEACCVPSYRALGDDIAVEGVRLVKEHLAAAVEVGNDIEARARVIAGAAAGATAFQKGLGAIHALSHPVGTLHNAHHGLTNAVCRALRARVQPPSHRGEDRRGSPPISV